MAQAQVTVKLEPAELAVIQEALMTYRMGLKGDNPATNFRRYTSNAILQAIGMGLPETQNGHKQLSFVAEEAEEDEGAIEEAEPVDTEEVEEEAEPVAA